jgi:hypothetical protein
MSVEDDFLDFFRVLKRYGFGGNYRSLKSNYHIFIHCLYWNVYCGSTPHKIRHNAAPSCAESTKWSFRSLRSMAVAPKSARGCAAALEISWIQSIWVCLNMGYTPSRWKIKMMVIIASGFQGTFKGNLFLDKAIFHDHMGDERPS